MARTLTESLLTTRNARVSLSLGVHWRGIDPDVHLGYRKGARGGRWLVRWYSGGRKYRQAPLGTADDFIGEGTLTFDAASKLARETVSQARRAAEAAAAGPMPTIYCAVTAYMKVRDNRASAAIERTIQSDASSCMKRHILGDTAFTGIELQALTESDLKGWRTRLDAALKAVTRQRIVNNLKAALNAAYLEHRKRLPADFAETVRHGLKLDVEPPAESPARDNQILEDARIRAIIETVIAGDTDGDFARLVIGLAATGARFSQLRRMRVRDAQAAQSRLLVPASRKGKKRVEGYTPVRVGADVLAALWPAIEGRDPSEPLFCRWRHVQVGPAQWQRASRRPWQFASEMTRPWRAVCEKMGLSGIVPYALRHSSIVRGIRVGLPIRLVAALHDTSVVMIERHYARWITDGLEDLAAKAIVPLMPNCQPLASISAAGLHEMTHVREALPS